MCFIYNIATGPNNYETGLCDYLQVYLTGPQFDIQFNFKKEFAAKETSTVIQIYET